MRRNLIPRKYRKHVLKIIKEFENGIGENDHLYKNWEQFLVYKYTGVQDGWISTNDKEYQSLMWLRGINAFISKMESF